MWGRVARRYENPDFKHSLLNSINNHKQTQKKEHIILVIFSFGVDVVTKTVNEIYVIGIIKIYCIHLFSLMCQRRSNRWNIESDVATLKILTTTQKRIYQVFWSSYVYCNCLIVALWSHEDIGFEILPVLQRIFACLSKTAIKIMKRNVKFVQTFFLSAIWLL